VELIKSTGSHSNANHKS